MKNLLIILTAVLCIKVHAQAPPDILNYQFNIALTDANDSINCSAVLELNATGTTINLDLISRMASGKGMKVSSVSDEATGRPLNYTHANNILQISVAAASSPHRIIRINYSGIPADGLIISKNKYNQRTFFADNWPNRGRNWLVCHDHPSDKASVDFIVTAPVHYQVVSNGVQTEETNVSDRMKLTHWHESVDLPVKVMGIGVAEFAVSYAGDAGNVPVYSWVYPADKKNGFNDYSVATQVLPFFAEKIAPYAYRKLANVESKTIFGGMENASAIFYSENSVTGKNRAEKLIAHEIAHQWFGNMATERDWPHLWLSEGFATYFTLLYLENKYGTDTLVSELRADRAKVINFFKERATPVVDTTVTDYMQLLNANSYEKGGWVLHMLRRQLGDSLFWKGIKTYYNTYKGKNAATDDFRTIMEESSGRDLRQFFRQWLYTAGHPVLHVDRSFSNKILTITITQQQDYTFQFPLVMVITPSGGDASVTKSVRIDKKVTTITLPVDTDAVNIVLDPATSLLFEEK